MLQHLHDALVYAAGAAEMPDSKNRVKPRYRGDRSSLCMVHKEMYTTMLTMESAPTKSALLLRTSPVSRVRSMLGRRTLASAHRASLVSAHRRRPSVISSASGVSRPSKPYNTFSHTKSTPFSKAIIYIRFYICNTNTGALSKQLSPHIRQYGAILIVCYCRSLGCQEF